MTKRAVKFAAYLDNLKLGVYKHRPNAGRRLLEARRRAGGRWRRVRDGLWLSKATGRRLLIKRLYV